MSLTSYRAALPRNLLVCYKADESIGFADGCKGYFDFFSVWRGSLGFRSFSGNLEGARNLDVWGRVG